MPVLRTFLLFALSSSLSASFAADNTALRVILRAEDDRRWGTDLQNLIESKDAAIRQRAIVAAGRIGDKRAVPVLARLLAGDASADARFEAAFALGEIESADAIDVLIEVSTPAPPGASPTQWQQIADIRAAAIEALGKICAAESTDAASKERIRKAIPRVPLTEIDTADRAAWFRLNFERRMVLLLTAMLRSRPENPGAYLSGALRGSSPAVSATALNVIARLRATEGADINAIRVLADSDPDPLVRGNAARVLGVAVDKLGLGLLSGKLLRDPDQRVRVMAIRALVFFEDSGVAPLLEYGGALLTAYRSKKSPQIAHPDELNEMLEIATTLGTVLKGTSNPEAIAWLKQVRAVEPACPEVEVAFAKIAPAAYLKENPFPQTIEVATLGPLLSDWRAVSAQAEGLGEIAAAVPPATTDAGRQLKTDAQNLLKAWLAHAALPVKAAPPVLSALSGANPEQLDLILRNQLLKNDLDTRATAATLLAERPPSDENLRALLIALTQTARDDRNDAALAILDGIASQKSRESNDAIRVLLRSPDLVIRQKVAGILRASGATDIPADLGRSASRIPDALYDRALSRIGKSVQARIESAKGSFTIDLLPAEAPLTVDNFIELAQRGYFNGLTFHRVVSNFVIQGGDPRGDGNGGPGYQIRCEINEVPFDRGAVGMALSGKDTGGSQWFVTHSPQPHLDGGYTVFGRVTSGMEVVDKIARGDLIQRVTITER